MNGRGFWMLLCAPFAVAETFTFADFKSTKGIELIQSAKTSGSALRLTPAKKQSVGAAWFGARQPVSNGFETTFQFQITRPGGLGPGADGFAFVIQNSGPTAIAGRGSAGGFAVGDGQGDVRRRGIARSIAIFFDTFKNGDGEPSANYLSICTNGKIPAMRWPPARLAIAPDLGVSLKDGAIHTVRVVYTPPIVSVFLDRSAVAVLASTVDFSTVVDADGTAYVGFTASTGGGYENHDILSWSFSSTPMPDVSSAMVSSNIVFLNTPCLPDRNLCTPARATVEETGPRQYHIILPANVEWGATVPGPGATIKNARGTVCWNLKSSGSAGCSGPAGSGIMATEGYLAPGEKAGALISEQRGGRTYFSVNDRSGAGFNENEGYFEFDVEVQ